MLIQNARLADGRQRDVRVEGERIAAVGRDLDGEADIDAAGKLLLPGMIDSHVHFREPGFPEKETWTSGSRAAAAGGVTTVIDQPNTKPPTIDGRTFDEKAAYATKSLVDFGLNGGVTPDWQPDELFSRPLFALGEVFLADSTGKMGIDTELFAGAVAEATTHDVPVTVHAEDATRFESAAKERDDADAWSAFRTAEAERVAIEYACEVARETGTTLHIAHTSTPAGIDLAAEAGMTCEVTPHHLLLSRDDYDQLGTFGRMNPPLRSEHRRKPVYERLTSGVVDIVATDHAPHTHAEKEGG
ncbi:MAG TPA: dihydroorotase, partial [Halococcus sp.]|nr:dihydroorotase [Halococcus sp.]